MTQPKEFHCDSFGECGDGIVRRACLADLRSVRALAEKVSTAAQWSREAYLAYCVSECEQQDLEAKIIFVASRSQRQEIVGFAAFHSVLATGECELENIVVSAELRKQGVGRRLLQAGLLWCRTWCHGPAADEESGGHLWLEVRASNSEAIAFYRQAGLAQVGRRAGYYTWPSEDAVLMQRPLHVPIAGL